MLFDLHLSMALLLGEVCGHSITVQPSVKTESVGSVDVDEDNEAVMLKSNLWKTLFRAGYQPTSDKMLQRSLSGRYVSYMGKIHMLMVSFLLNFIQTSYIFNVILMNMLKQSKTNTIIHRKLNLRIFTDIVLLFKILSKLVFATVSICGLNVLWLIQNECTS